MISKAVKAALRARNVNFTELGNGDVFFRRPYDHQSMYIRSFPDGTYTWSQNAARNDTNLIDIRPREVALRHNLSEVLQRVDDFLGLIVAGRIVIDTLGIARKAMDRGIGRENAERVAAIARKVVLDMHESGMDAEEIKTRFDEICEQLHRERFAAADRENSPPGVTGGDA